MNFSLPAGGIVLGLGTDVIEIDRIRGVLDRQGERFLDRVFTAEEGEDCFSMKHPHKHLPPGSPPRRPSPSASRPASAPNWAGNRCRSTTANARSRSCAST